MKYCARILVLLALCGLTSLAGADVAADFDKAAAAHKRGDYQAAARLWEGLAEKGVVNAQFNLGQMYRYADGVARDPAVAAKWYRKAAEQGDKASQFNLGSMYLNGEGVKMDEAEAHRWFTLNRQHHAHHHHDPQFVAWQRQAAELIDAEQRRVAYENSRHGSDQFIAELRARAGLTVAPATRLAASR